jgi:hypothetical protein
MSFDLRNRKPVIPTIIDSIIIEPNLPRFSSHVISLKMEITAGKLIPKDMLNRNVRINIPGVLNGAASIKDAIAPTSAEPRSRFFRLITLPTIKDPRIMVVIVSNVAMQMNTSLKCEGATVSTILLRRAYAYVYQTTTQTVAMMFPKKVFGETPIFGKYVSI